MRWYGYFAILSILICQYLMFQKMEPVYTFFTPIQWWNYLFLADAIVAYRKKSLIFDETREFFIMLVLSNVCWLIFEWYNFLLENWYYTGLALKNWQRMLGSFTAFATIFPGIFLSARLLERFGIFRNVRSKPRKISSSFLLASFLAGAGCCLFPLFFPSQYIFGMVWLGYFFLLDPLNYWMKNPSIYADFEQGKTQRLWLLLAGGALCGFLWEFWNYWAGAKWIYTVPFTRNFKYFEMPLLGLLGFPPFALECFAMYHFARGLLERRVQPPGLQESKILSANSAPLR